MPRASSCANASVRAGWRGDFFSCAYCTFYDIPKCKPVPRGNKAGEAINYTGKKEKEVKLTGQEAELCRLNWPYFIA